MNLLLTGRRGVGKSTALNRTLELLGVVPGGFRTGFTQDRTRLCLWPAWKPPDWSRERTVARMENGVPIPSGAAFDRLGPVILSESRPWACLLLLDELGRLEWEAAVFQQAVADCLAGPLPVLGVVKPDRAGSWLEGLCAAPDTQVLTVTEENRAALPALLAERLRPLLATGRRCRTRKNGKI